MPVQINPKFKERIKKDLDAGTFKSVTDAFTPAIQWVVKELDRRGLACRVLNLGAGVKKVVIEEPKPISEPPELDRIREVVNRYQRTLQAPAAYLQEITGILVSANRKKQRPAFLTIKPELTCCEQTLLELDKVVEYRGKTICSGTCKDGERIECTRCHKTMVHICDEAEGCYWSIEP